MKFFETRLMEFPAAAQFSLLPEQTREAPAFQRDLH